ncbi:MAG: cyclic nucleotide-binding domain-containing protein, partial [Gammaproteobacteria bacterium]|nr:cyclic nucleotide-binding domain-containing protein [Gammaproteobacteria bacterium]
LATLGTGDFFGETALLGDETRTATVVAEEPATLLRLNRREVLAVAAEDREFDRHLQSAAVDRQRAPDAGD